MHMLDDFNKISFSDFDETGPSGKNKVTRNKKNYVGFLMSKVWQILKHFAGTFHQA